MKTLEEILKLDPNLTETLFYVNEFVSEVVSVFHSSPNRIKGGDTIENLYDRFKKREIGGWCGLTAQYLQMIFKRMKINSFSYNYGIPRTEFTHVVVIAEGYLLDPYFNKIFVDKSGNALMFKDLIKKIKERDFSFQPLYGKSLKSKRTVSNEFISLRGEEWEKSLMNSWKQKSFNEIMKSEFGGENPEFLMLYDIKDTK